jgi:hypothetical protein
VSKTIPKVTQILGDEWKMLKEKMSRVFQRVDTQYTPFKPLINWCDKAVLLA